MDSLSHIIIGAAIGGATLEKKVGSKAFFWGAIAASLPDIDGAYAPLFDSVTALFVHRGFSHSFLFVLLTAPILGLIISQIHKNSASFKEWYMLSFLALLSHVVMDFFNTYGTALFYPFSSARLAFDAVGIIDIFLLLPIVTLMIIALLKPKYSNTRRNISLSILIFTAFFFFLASMNKKYIEQTARRQLAEIGIQYSRLKTSPLPVTNFLWLILAEDELGYHVGYLSNFDSKKIDFHYINRNAHLIDTLKCRRINRLLNFTERYYTVEQINNGELWVHDLRYGSMAFHSKDEWYVFSFKIETDNNETTISRAHPNRSFKAANFANYISRVFKK